MIALLGVLGSLALEPVEPRTAPAVQSEPCEGAGVVARASRVVGTAEALVLHECGSAESRGLLAIHTAGVWFVAPNSWIAFERVSSNIIRRVQLVRDHLGAGELANGTKAILYTIETLNGTTGALRIGRTIVCSTGRDIACSKPIAYVCANDSCTAPRLSRGVLIVTDADDGVQRYAVSSEPASEPQR